MSDDANTAAEGAAEAPGTPEPTPVVPPASASYETPAGTAAPGAELPGSPLDRPEVAVGAAFAGGLLAAMILRRFGR